MLRIDFYWIQLRFRGWGRARVGFEFHHDGFRCLVGEVLRSMRHALAIARLPGLGAFFAGFAVGKGVFRIVSVEPHRDVAVAMRMHWKLTVTRLGETEHPDLVIFKDYFHLI